MFIQFIAILLMVIGVAVIIIPKFHGAIIILAGCVLYTTGTSWQSLNWLLTAVMAIAVITELSVTVLARYLIYRYKISPRLSADVAAGNIAGIVVTDALFGLLGTVAFETVVSKAILPRLSTMANVFIYMAVGALFRIACGIVMIFLVLMYV